MTVGSEAVAYPTFAECLREKSGPMAGLEKSYLAAADAEGLAVPTVTALSTAWEDEMLVAAGPPVAC